MGSIGRPRITLERKKIICKQLKSGASYREIAKLMGCSLGVITKIAREYELEIHTINPIVKEADKQEIADFIPSDQRQAVKVHRAVMSMVDEKPGLALSAADKVLDRIQGKPMQKVVNENINVEITPDKIREMLNSKGFSFVTDNL